MNDPILNEALVAERDATAKVATARKVYFEAKGELADASKRVRGLLADLIADRPLFAPLDRANDVAAANGDVEQPPEPVAKPMVPRFGRSSRRRSSERADARHREAIDRARSEPVDPDWAASSSTETTPDGGDVKPPKSKRPPIDERYFLPPQNGWTRPALVARAGELIGDDTSTLRLVVCNSCNALRFVECSPCPVCGNPEYRLFASELKNHDAPANGSRARIRVPKPRKRLEVPGATEDRG